MKSKETIYITGHQHPDTDSIASAIAYAFYKKANGISAVACRLGPVNAESRYLLERFGFPEPVLIKDARVRLSEIELDPLTYIGPETTIYESLQLMKQEKHTYCGVVDEECHLLGLVTKSDIANIGLGDTSESIEVMKLTSAANFCKTINGRMIYDDPDIQLNGKVSVVTAADEAGFEKYDVEGRIVVLGGRKETQLRAIEKGAGILVIVWAAEVDPEVIETARIHHCPIIISGHGGTNTVRYLYFAPSVKQIMTTRLITFMDTELAEDVGNKMLRSRYHIYPVVDAENHLKGYVARYHIMNAGCKKFVLVDHNEFAQSVRAIEKARVIEVIDHHRINDFHSTLPVQFRNEIVGSTATVIATMFRENQIPMHANMAALLLGAIISDTLNFHSPTTTDKDRQTANILAALADLDIETFAGDIFRVSANTDGKNPTDLITQDIKVFDIQGCKLSVSQVMVSRMEDFHFSHADIQKNLEIYAGKKDLDIAVLAITSIMENGSAFIYAGNHWEWAREAYADESDGTTCLFHPGVLSRKSQIVPRLTEVIAQYQS